MSTPTQTPTRPHAPTPSAPRLGHLDGVGTIFSLELRQRLRSRGWYVMLGLWFVVVLGVTLAVGAAVRSSYTSSVDPETGLSLLPPGSVGAGQIQFELAIAFVLGFGSLIAPVFAANAISGDRAGGTLAIVQATLVTPGQILWGKWLAAWVASLAFLVAALPSLAVAAFSGELRWGSCLLMLLVVAVELGVLCAIGVGISAGTSRPLFSILATYLVVAALGLGTLIVTGVAAMTVHENVRSSQMEPTPEASKAMLEWDEKMSADPEKYADLPYPPEADDVRCGTEVTEWEAPATERFTWLLAANPFVVLADAAAPPLDPVLQDGSGYAYFASPQAGILGSVRMGVRQMQAGPQSQVTCLEGKVLTPPKLSEQAPVWPVGLGVQLLLTAAIVGWGRRRLVTPAGRLASGTRVA